MTPSSPAFAAAAHQSSGRRVEVSTVLDLRSALADEGVSHVLMLPGDSWNFSREEWGAEAVRLHRPVLMEGVLTPDGTPPYGEWRRQRTCSGACQLARLWGGLLSGKVALQ